VNDPLRRLVGAVVGGAIGYGVFRILEVLELRFLGVVGVGLALGAGFFATRRHIGWGLVFMVVAFVVSVVIEWYHHPFPREALSDYFLHFWGLSWRSKANHLAAAAAGLWFGSGRTRRPRA